MKRAIFLCLLLLTAVGCGLAVVAQEAPATEEVSAEAGSAEQGYDEVRSEPSAGVGADTEAGAPSAGDAEGEPAPETPAVPSTAEAESSALAEALDREIEQRRAYLAEIERLTESLAERRTQQHEALSATRTATAELSAQLQLLNAGAAQAEPAYDKVVGLLVGELDALGESLERLRGGSQLPPFSSNLDPAKLVAPDVEERLATLAELDEKIRSGRQALQADQEALTWEELDQRVVTLSRLSEVRTAAIRALPSQRRRAVLGISREGIDALQLEGRQLGAVARTYVHRTVRSLRQVPEVLQDFFAVGRVTWMVLKLLLVLIAVLLLRRRQKEIKKQVLAWALELASNRRGEERMRGLVDFLARLTSPIVILSLVPAIRWALAAAATRPEVSLPLKLLLLFGIYRLATALTYSAAVWLSGRYRLRLVSRQSAEVLRTIRAVMRTVFLLVALLLLSAQVMGRGVMYHWIVWLAWLVGLLMFFAISARWRAPIADAYLAASPGGRLARLVSSTRKRWYGFVVSAAAFVWLACRGLLIVLRDFAMSFDSTRRALAFIFRRRMERQAEVSGYAESDPTELPDPFRAAASEQVTRDEALLVDHFPGFDRLQQMLQSWRDGSRGSFLVSGPKGIGKSTWLALVDGGEFPVKRIPVPSRVHTRHALCNLLAQHLIEGDDCKDMTALGKQLREGPPKIAVVDPLQNLFLSRVGGYKVIQAFVSLMESTSDRVFWVSAMSRFACEHLLAVHPELAVFRHHQRLAPWSEQQIGALIDRRVKALDLDVEYAALLADRVSRGAFDERTLEAAESYARLIWDYSGGIPRVALHFWLRSLEAVSEKRARVKLFRAPDETELLQLGQKALFLLAAIVIHENLSLAEAATVTRYPEPVCRIQLERMRDRKMLSYVDRRYRMTTYWHRAIIRTLTRNNLIPD